MAADGATGGGDGEELLLRAVEDGVGSEGGVGLCVGERPWRLNFDGFRRPEAHQEKPGRGLQDCLGVLAQGSGDDVAEYYQQQWEMLEGFNEMDTLADRGFLPGMSKGILVFASVMATLGLQIILESTRSLVSNYQQY